MSRSPSDAQREAGQRTGALGRAAVRVLVDLLDRTPWVEYDDLHLVCHHCDAVSDGAGVLNEVKFREEHIAC